MLNLLLKRIKNRSVNIRKEQLQQNKKTQQVKENNRQFI